MFKLRVLCVPLAGAAGHGRGRKMKMRGELHTRGGMWQLHIQKESNYFDL